MKEHVSIARETACIAFIQKGLSKFDRLIVEHASPIAYLVKFDSWSMCLGQGFLRTKSGDTSLFS